MSRFESINGRTYRKPSLARHGSVEHLTNGAPNTGSSDTAIFSATGSSRDIKEAVVPADIDDVLRRLSALPISTWSYKEAGEPTRHIGPMAQDFAAAFGVGRSDRYINSIDAIGVTMAAVQALETRVRELSAEVAALKKRLEPADD
jgi:hypothetical protein